MDGPVLDVCTIDRCEVDLYPLGINTHPEDVTRFGKFLGGSSANVVVATAYMGHLVACITGVGNDPFGRFIRSRLTRSDVNARRVAVNPAFNTPVTFCEVFPPDNFPLFFYRQPTTPDLETDVDDLPNEVATTCILWLTVSDLSMELSWSASHEALRCHHGSGINVLNFDYRARFWPSEQEAAAQAQQAFEHADVAIGGLEECRITVGKTDPDAVALVLLGRGVEVAVVKQEVMGTLTRTTTEQVYVPTTSVRVHGGLGADDGFGGAVCHGLLKSWDLTGTLAFASAAGAIVVSQLECSTAMLRIDKVGRLMAANLQVAPVVSRIRH